MAKRNRERSGAMIHVQTYFTITEAPFGRAVDLAYGAIVAVPARAVAQLPLWIPSYREFHSLIQLPGAFIVR